MKYNKRNVFFFGLFFILLGFTSFTDNSDNTEDKILSYVVDPEVHDIKFYWQKNKEDTFKSIANLKTWIEKNHQTLIFAMNGGMYKPGNIPQGLFIENRMTVTPLDTTSGKGNFYLKPNGIFYITEDKQAVICKTTDFQNNGKIKYATQSGPMLVIDGKIHSAFKEGSTNLNIRNGVGILPNNKVIFAISKEQINFYDFAKYFKELGCQNALYLDGFVSRMYLPQKNWMQTDGDFGVIIGITALN